MVGSGFGATVGDDVGGGVGGTGVGGTKSVKGREVQRMMNLLRAQIIQFPRFEQVKK